MTSILAAVALTVLLINIILSLKSDSRSAIYRPQTKSAQFIWSLIWIAVILLWFGTRMVWFSPSTYLAIVFGCFALMQFSQLLKNLKAN